MIKRRTVLILGAGASAPFGFPVGRALRIKIVADLQKSASQLSLLLVESGYAEGQINRFRDALQLANQPSVDVFLEHRSEFKNIGKLAIAASLIPYEDEKKLFGVDDNWYEYLFSRLGPSKQDVMNSKLSIITFNYDRSIDHFLFASLRNSFSLGTDETRKILTENIPIVHVHGKLGKLPFEDDGRGDSRSYTPSEPGSEAGLAMAASSAIKIVHEGTKDDPDFIHARKIIESAELVCFLGFGYLEANIERLQVHQWPEAISPLYGSAYMFMEAEITAASAALGRPLKAWVGDALASLRYLGVLS
jgi:hypothetical protein